MSEARAGPLPTTLRRLPATQCHPALQPGGFDGSKRSGTPSPQDGAGTSAACSKKRSEVAGTRGPEAARPPGIPSLRQARTTARYTRRGPSRAANGVCRCLYASKPCLVDCRKRACRSEMPGCQGTWGKGAGARFRRALPSPLLHRSSNTDHVDPDGAGLAQAGPPKCSAYGSWRACIKSQKHNHSFSTPIRR